MEALPDCIQHISSDVYGRCRWLELTQRKPIKRRGTGKGACTIVKISEIVLPTETIKAGKVERLTQKVEQPVIEAESSYTSLDEATAKAFIYMKESSNNQYAINESSGACGLGQALPCSKMGCELSDYECQDNYFTDYMSRRYGSWANAVVFWEVNRWW